MIDLGINLFQEIAALGGGGGFSITNSLRFNDDDGAYLSRTPSVSGNRKTWTWSGWVKRGNLSSSQFFFGANSGATADGGLIFTASDTLGLTLGGNVYNKYTTAVLRDVSGWYHIVAVLDTDNATAANRIKLYVNGLEQTAYTTQNSGLPPSGYTPNYLNNANNHNIGKLSGYAQDYFDGYMAEINFIDGQALTPNSFGQIDAATGEWSPKAYAGTYGTNGFYLPFDGNANDDSGNGNNWTENNLASTDYMIDTPTNNFAVLNSIANLAALSEGNLNLTNNVTSSWQSVVNTIGVSSGKWYFETCSPTTLSNPPYTGIGITTDPNYGLRTGTNYLGGSADSWSYLSLGKKYTNAISSLYGATYTAGDVIGCALDMDAGTVTFYKNNVSQSVAFTGLSGTMFCGASVYAASGTASNNINFGADSSFAGNKTRQGNTDANGIGDFYYTPPAGYLALCTDNLPAPAIEQPETQFNVVTWTGNSTTNRAITGVGFQPDLVWIKRRDGTDGHIINDSVRGIPNNLFPFSTIAENTTAYLSSLDSDGFTLDTVNNATNLSGGSYVAWCWKAGGTAVANTDGSITSQVSANVDAGFSIVSWTGTGGGADTIGHGLDDAPEFIITKTRTASTAYNWNSYHVGVDATAPEDYFIALNTTAERASYTAANTWNRTKPTGSVFSVNHVATAGPSGDAMIAYCFHSVEGFSKFGSYVGNGSADGPFVYTGFKPAFVLYKRAIGGTGNWILYDNEREGYNGDNPALYPNLSLEEATSGTSIDFLANGFKILNSASDHNTSGNTYIYMAFAEHPFKEALAR